MAGFGSKRLRVIGAAAVLTAGGAIAGFAATQGGGSHDPSGAASAPGAQRTTGDAAGSAAASGPTTTGLHVGDQVVASAQEVPKDFPKDVPLPSTGLISALSNTGGDAKKFDLSYSGTDLSKLVGDLRDRLRGAGFEISGEYSSRVKGVPSAGFVAKSKTWTITVGGVTNNGAAAMSVSVISG